MSTIGTEPFGNEEIVWFINGPWDGVQLWAKKPHPRRVWPRLVTVAPLKGGPLPPLFAARLGLPVELADMPGGTHVYRKYAPGLCLFYYYAAHPRNIWSSS